MPEVYAPEAEVDSSLRRKPVAYLQLSVGEKALVATSLKSSSSPILTFFYDVEFVVFRQLASSSVFTQALGGRPSR